MNSISAYNVSGDDSRLVDSIVCVINYEANATVLWQNYRASRKFARAGKTCSYTNI